MASVRDFTLDDKLFPRLPSNSLLFNDLEIMELQHRWYQVYQYQANKHDLVLQTSNDTDPAHGDRNSSKMMGTPKRKYA